MSHSQGAVKVGDSIYWVEYNGTVDVLLPRMYATQEELVANWRRRDWPQKCPCTTFIEARVAVTYGRGFSWMAKVCLTCMRVIEPLDSINYYDSDYEDGLPDWYPNREQYILHDE